MMNLIGVPLFTIGLALLLGGGIVALCALVFRRFENLWRRLSIRIALLILLTGPAVLIGLIILNIIYVSAIGQPSPWWAHIIQLAFIVITTPLLLGLLASRFVTRPLAEFTAVIASIKDNDYHLRLQKPDIYEFDHVFAEFNELFERLSEEETLRRNLIADTSHELKTPLTALIGQLEGIRDGVIQNDAAHVNTLLSEALRLQDTAERLVDYARLQSSTLAVKPQPVDVRTTLAELRHECAQELKQAHIQLVANEPLKIIYADPMLFKRLLSNLIINAARHSGGTKVTISYDGSMLVVADDGNGVPAASLPNLFERFYRVDASRSRASGGLGLGLAIVREIALSHGWRIAARNTETGLMFTIETSFIRNSQAPVLLEAMKRPTTFSQLTRSTNLKSTTPWICAALVALGIAFFAYTAVQQNLRMGANDPQIQIAEDTAAAWDNGAAPSSLVAAKPVDLKRSLAPFTIIVDASGNVLASGGQLNGATPLPPAGVFHDAATKGERRFTWQTEGGLRFATIVMPTQHGSVFTARSLQEVENREQTLTLMAALTIVGIMSVLIVGFVLTVR